MRRIFDSGKSWVVVGILASLMVLGAGAWTKQALSVPVAAYSAQGAEIQAHPIPDTVDVLGGARGAYGDVSQWVDADGDLIVAFKNENTANSNETWAEVHEYNRAGASKGVWRIYPSQYFKIDGVSLTFSCPDAKVALTTHSYEVIGRTKQVEEGLIEGIFSCGPGGQAAMIAKGGGANAYQPLASVQQPAQVDYEFIRTIMREEAQAAVQRAIDNLLPKMGVALNNAGVLTLGNIYGSAGLYGRIRETSYQSSLEALGAYGVTRQPTATPTATPRP